MATLSMGMFKMEVKYINIEQIEKITHYTYAIRLFIKDAPLFSEKIENEMLSKEGRIVVKSEEKDYLLQIFERITDQETPMGTLEQFCSEIGAPQLIFISVSKKYIPRLKIEDYHIKIQLNTLSFAKHMGVGDITLETHDKNPDGILDFVKEMEAEKAQFMSNNN